MIIVNFIIDLMFLIFLPVNTFFIVNEIDKNEWFNVVFIGLLVDFMYYKLFVFLSFLLIFYLIVRKFKIKNKYYYMKNIFLFVIFYIVVSLFNKSFNIILFGISFILQIIYMFLYKKLLK